MSERSDNDPSQHPKQAGNMRDIIRKFAGCECLDSLQPSDSDEVRRNTAEGIASRLEMWGILNTSPSTLRRQQARQAESLETNRRLQATLATAAAAIALFPSGRIPPPSYNSSPLVQGENNAPTAPENASSEGPDPEPDGATVRPVPMNLTRLAYLRQPHRFMFTPVPTTPQSDEAPDNPFMEFWTHSIVMRWSKHTSKSITVSRWYTLIKIGYCFIKVKS